jgi:hypothetical protein
MDRDGGNPSPAFRELITEDERNRWLFVCGSAEMDVDADMHVDGVYLVC